MFSVSSILSSFYFFCLLTLSLQTVSYLTQSVVSIPLGFLSCLYLTILSLFCLLSVESFHQSLTLHIFYLIFLPLPFNFPVSSWQIIPDIFSVSSPLSHSPPSLTLSSRWHLIPQWYCHCISSFMGLLLRPTHKFLPPLFSPWTPPSFHHPIPLSSPFFLSQNI